MKHGSGDMNQYALRQCNTFMGTNEFIISATPDMRPSGSNKNGKL